MVGRKLSQYRLLSKLGGGASTEVYSAEDTEADRTVALKLFRRDHFDSDAARANFIRAVRAIAAVNHPAVCPIFEVDEAEGLVFASMALLTGETLEARIRRSPLALAEVVRVSLQIAEGLQATKQCGVRLKDLNLRNAFLVPESQGNALRLTEFSYEFREPAPGCSDGPGSDPDVALLGRALTQLITVKLDLPGELTGLIARCGNVAEIISLLQESARKLETLQEESEATQIITSPVISAVNVSQTSGDHPAETDEPWRDVLRRYTSLGLLGRGGMGEVFRVRDSYLNRSVAMKILHLPGARVRERFLEEAQVTAQLQHPAIIPVYDVGTLVDGRPYFTMKEIVGRTFSAVISDAHREWQLAAEDPAYEVGPDGIIGRGKWSVRRLIGDFQRLCEGVAYAHKLGVLHRDLKPSNLMIGEFGEVLVVDWGLTRVSDTADGGSKSAGGPISKRSHSEEFSTRFGTVIGTPSFMPPEQATGDLPRIGPHSDVYSLGAVLYTILDGRPPSGRGKSAHAPPPPLGRRASSSATGPFIPVELKMICEKAMAWEPAHRYQDAGALAEVLALWLEGAQRRERAMSVLAQARDLKPEIAQNRARSAQLDAEAAAGLEGIPPFAPVAAKTQLWALQDEATALRNRSQLNEVYYTQLVRAALTHAGDLEAANEMLAEHYQEQHRKAEAARDANTAAQFEILLRDHDRGRYTAYLKGDGALSLDTDPPSNATLFRYEEKERRLFPVHVADLGQAPLGRYSLPMGSYVVKLSSPGRIDVDYPVFIERQHHWNGVRPGSSTSHPIYLPKAGDLGPEDCYVPPGWFWSGGDAQARNALPARRYWLDGFVMRRFHVAVGEYLLFLNDLVAQGRDAEAAQHAPPAYEWEKIEKASTLKDVGVVRDDSGRYVFTGSEDKLRWPQEVVNWAGATAYCNWLAAKEGLPWRLPTEMEHEKAARGVDCRFFPWGDFLDPTFCAMRLSHSGVRAVRATVDEYPANVSPYGIRGLSGNVYSWCEDAFSPAGPAVVNDIPHPPDPAVLKGPGAGGGHRVVRGGSWRDPEWNCRAAHRDSPPAHFRDSTLGFRILRSFPLTG